MLLLLAVVVSWTVLQAAPQHFLFSKIYLQLATHIDIGPFHDTRYAGASRQTVSSKGQLPGKSGNKRMQAAARASCS